MVRQADRRASTTMAILSAGRALLSEHGYDKVSVDDIVKQAGVAKGAFYHHFPSKRDILERLVEAIQAEIAEEMTSRLPSRDKSGALADSLGYYLRTALRDDRRRILLVDGPTVLGWERWREIDDRYFAAATKAGLARLMGDVDGAELDAAVRLLLGAVMEAALASGAAADPLRAVEHYMAALRRMVTGLEPRSLK